MTRSLVLFALIAPGCQQRNERPPSTTAESENDRLETSLRDSGPCRNDETDETANTVIRHLVESMNSTISQMEKRVTLRGMECFSHGTIARFSVPGKPGDLGYDEELRGRRLDSPVLSWQGPRIYPPTLEVASERHFSLILIRPDSAI